MISLLWVLLVVQTRWSWQVSMHLAEGPFWLTFSVWFLLVQIHLPLGAARVAEHRKKTISGWSCCKAFEGAKGQSRNGTKRLRLTASRARLGAETEHALGAARVAARRKRQGRFLELLQGL